MHSRSSLYLFRRDYEGRRAFRRAFFRASKDAQRAIFLWVTNMATGKWRRCTRCRAEATKKHMETCVLGWDGETEAPSRIEGILRCATHQSLVDKAGEVIMFLMKQTSAQDVPTITRPSSAERTEE